MDGQRFGAWVVIGTADKSADGLTSVRCRCDCGTIRNVPLTLLRRGRSKGCGCVRAAKARLPSPAKGTHKSSHTAEYRSWKGAIARCHNPKATGYSNYGGRGISVCDRWRNDFHSFLADMGSRPNGTSLERTENSGNYEPGNCKWATSTEQRRNTRNNLFIEIDGVTKCMIEWCAHFGVPKSTAQKRISTLGWSPQDAVSKPVRRGR